jgi:hypothetical protein
MMHNIACIFAQAAARAEVDREQVNRRALAEGHRSRALEAVRNTLQMVDPEVRRSFWQDKMLPDTALAPLREEAGFKRLEAEYAQPRWR